MKYFYLFSFDFTFFVHPIKCTIEEQLLLNQKINSLVVHLQEPLYLKTGVDNTVLQKRKVDYLILSTRYEGDNIFNMQEFPFFCNAYIAVDNLGTFSNINKYPDFTCEIYQTRNQPFDRGSTLFEKIIKRILSFFK